MNVSTHSRPKAADHHRQKTVVEDSVSTHSRPKAAVVIVKLVLWQRESFNTQPPEGGW